MIDPHIVTTVGPVVSRATLCDDGDITLNVGFNAILLFVRFVS